MRGRADKRWLHVDTYRAAREESMVLSRARRSDSEQNGIDHTHKRLRWDMSKAIRFPWRPESAINRSRSGMVDPNGYSVNVFSEVYTLLPSSFSFRLETIPGPRCGPFEA
jgi:hypothetical protein